MDGFQRMNPDTSNVEIDSTLLLPPAAAQSYKAVDRVLNSLDALVYVADMHTHELVYLNDYGVSIWGAIARRKCYQVFQHSQTGPCDFCTNKKLVDDNGGLLGAHVWEIQNPKNNRWYQCRDQAITWIDGRTVRLEIATDITERKLMEQALHDAKALAEKLADTDELTQLNNRRAFFNQGKRVVQQTQRSKTCLSLIMFDLDNFKQINDQFGHAAGDAVLVNIAALATQLVRAADMLARIGGEEFAIILPDTALRQAEQLAQRMRFAFDAQSIILNGETIHCTASFGIATLDLTQATSDVLPQNAFDELLNSADQAMMQAKRQGRNRVAF